MKLRGMLAATALVISSAALADQPVARIICGEHSTDSWNIVTMRSDVYPSYRSPSLELQDQDGKKIHGLTEPTLVSSNGLDLDLFVIASPFKAPPVLYRSLMSIPRRSGLGVKIANIIPASGNLTGYLKSGELNAKRLGYSAMGLLAYPADSEAYTILNVNTNKSVKVKVKATDAGNPQFSADGKWLALDVVDLKTYTITTKIFSVTSGQVVNLPPAAKGLSQVTPSFAGDYVTWTETKLAASPNGYAMTLLAARLNGLNEKSATKTILTDRNPRLKGIRVYQDLDGAFFTAVSKETYKASQDSDYSGRGFELTRGEVFINYFDKNLQPTAQDSIPYSPKLIGSKRRTSMDYDNVLAREQFFSPSNTMIFTLGDLYGIATLDIKNKVWDFHSNQNSTGCYNPAIGPEGAE